MDESEGETGLDPDLSNRLSRDAEAIRRWVYAVAVVKFDIDHGPIIECVYPDQILSDPLKYIIQMTCIPDSAKSHLEDRVFTIRIAIEDLFAVVYFRQTPDSSASRGYFQKSFVVLSKLPLIELWESISSVLAPIYFMHGSVSVIEAAAHNWSDWPDPFSLKGMVQLPFLGQMISVNIELSMQMYGNSIYGIYGHIPIYDTFQSCLDSLWNLWELVIKGEPLLILADNPTSSTNIVLGLISLISSSFLYYADYRPYFTIGDPDYRGYLTMYNHNRLPGCILGTTSKFFLDSFPDFPNIFRMDDASYPVLITEHKSHIRCDKAFLKTLDSFQDKNAELRRYFTELTLAFTNSFDCMFKPLPYIPRDSNHSQVFNPFLDQPKLPEFHSDQFLKALLSSKLSLAPLKRYLSSKKRISSLILAIIMGPNFLPWFDSKRTKALLDIDAQMDAAIIAADMDEIVDSLSLSEAELMMKEIKRRRHCQRTKTRAALVTALDQHYEIVKDVISRLNYSHT